MTKKITHGLSVLILVIFAAFSQAPALKAAEDGTINGVCIDCIAKDLAFHGVILIGNSKQVLFEKAYTNESKPGDPISIEARYNIGSMTKMMTATAIAQLVEAGKMQFGDPVRKYLPSLPETYDAIKIEHLLSHTSGLGNYLNPANMPAIASHKTVSDLMALMDDAAPSFEPGSKMSYSNSGYTVLGAVIEAVSGQSWEDYLAKNIFEKAGMNNSSTSPSMHDAINYSNMTRMPERRRRDANGNRVAPTPPPMDNNAPYSPSAMNNVMGMPAGGTYHSAADLYKFMRALQNGTLVSKETFDRMTTPTPNTGITAPSGDRILYGFGLMIAENNNRIGHGGGAPGVNAELRAWLKEGLIVVGTTNIDPPMASQMVSNVGKAFIK